MLMNLDVLEKPQPQYKVGDIITENIPFVSFDNLTEEGLALYYEALDSAEAKEDEALIFRILKSVRQGKENSKNVENYLKNLIDPLREFGHVFYSDKIVELEVFPWTHLTR